MTLLNNEACPVETVPHMGMHLHVNKCVPAALKPSKKVLHGYMQAAWYGDV